jgi:hypothetical protein
VALANKTARIVWAVMARGDGYRSKDVIGQAAQAPKARTACEGEEEVMASGRAADREDPDNSRRNAARSLDRDPISELHQGQRSCAPHQRAGHMTAPDHIAKAETKTFAGGDRPHMNYAAWSDLGRNPRRSKSESELTVT